MGGVINDSIQYNNKLTELSNDKTFEQITRKTITKNFHKSYEKLIIKEDKFCFFFKLLSTSNS